ncbi:hypothetical protein S1OALGB6SA_722 [Olavius algarvensis spirochete endosymbiont]|uniref:DciA family protein n=1 Tax=Olavius algarvensis spirochete endosymbiont TaxID=260710 RepID=UPI00068EBB78|nr:DUF721 domain-containing protein [Olavius algarvensis spirochete endosymbiont]CAD7844416.1 MAG: hypothetical protein [Olavius algarvensis spirochete endosymbiont]VDA99651.1 hypothetical protein S1OALGB6SA_722 [Olavius algarvensis spirochete endosymbiont]
MIENENFIHAGELIRRLIEELVSNEKREYSRMSVGWDEIAGTEVAMHVFPRDIENNVLLLETDHPGWSQRILMMQGSLLKKIKNKYPQLKIKKIKVFIGDGRRSST